MHPKNKQVRRKVLSGGLKNPNPRQEVNLVVIYIYFSALALHLEKKSYHCIIILKPHVSTFTVCKKPQEYSPWWDKNKNTMHSIISEKPKILDRQPTEFYHFENISNLKNNKSQDG